MPVDTCPDCGADRANGDCPRWRVPRGNDGPTLARDVQSATIDRTPEPDHARGATIDWEPTADSVVGTIGATTGPVPRVRLRDTETEQAAAPIVGPGPDGDPTRRYRIDGELGRGGMGEVFKGRDHDLGRDVALKVLRQDLNQSAHMVHRFVEEAQIGGQLQHPGVVPVYELGTLADHRPFFSMKLVKGQTFAELLAARTTPADGLPRFLSIYAAIAQTMAYAHTRGVIHRDLKPSNVMVGGFGEVQVMAWGLAKVLSRDGSRSDVSPGDESPADAVIATARSSAGTDLSHAGSLMGTPSYMAPEQARGETERVDERADVFALGSILCDILTGAPAFTGRTSSEVLRKAAQGDMADARARLDGCGAEAELIALAKDCLAGEVHDRPRDAGLLAERITAYLSGVQERVQADERERAVAVARAIEERRRRKVQFQLAASVLAFPTLGGLSATYYVHQRQARAAAVERVVGQAVTLRDQALAHPEDLSRWQVALAAVEQAEAGSEGAARDRLLALRTQVKAGRGAAQRDKALLDRLVDIRSAEADDSDGSTTDHAYADAFLEAGIDLASLAPGEAGAIRARPPSVALELAGALDDWAASRRERRTDAAGSARLGAAARAADPDPWRNQLRTALDEAGKVARLDRLRALAKTAKLQELSAVSLHLLGTGLNRAGDRALAESALRTAQERHPQDVWVNRALAQVLEKRSHRDEAIRFYTAARAVRPETAHELAHALERRGDSAEAVAVFRDLRRLRPGNVRHLLCLGTAFQEQGLAREANEALGAAVVAGRDALRLKPDAAMVHGNLATALIEQHKDDEASAEFRTAIRLMPDFALFHSNLGLVLSNQGKHDEAIAEFRTAIRLEPDFAAAHREFGRELSKQGRHDEAVVECRTATRLMPDDAAAHVNLGDTLSQQGKHDEAVAEFRTAIRLKPDHPAAHCNLGAVLCDGLKDYPAAEREFRTAIRLKPDMQWVHLNLAAALSGQGRHDEVIAELRAAIRLQPDLTEAHDRLASELLAEGKRDEAITEYRAVIRLTPGSAEAHCNIGMLLKGQDDYTAALEMLRKGHELGSPRPDWQYPSAQWVAQAEHELALAKRLPAMLRGDDNPADTAERVAFAVVAHSRKEFVVATRLWTEAFQADPGLLNDLNAGHRYSAACAAAMAGSGLAGGDQTADEAARSAFRNQSRDWLRAELDLRSKQLGGGKAEDRAGVVQALEHWKHDSDLAGMRDSQALAQLPRAQRKEWQAIWADVDALLKRAEKPN